MSGDKPSEYQGLPVRKSLKNYGNLREDLTPADFDALEKQARETFAKAEAETIADSPGGRTAAGKAKRLKAARDYQRKARRSKTPEQKRRQVEWTRNWRHKKRTSK